MPNKNEVLSLNPSTNHTHTHTHTQIEGREKKKELLLELYCMKSDVINTHECILISRNIEISLQWLAPKYYSKITGKKINQQLMYK
jgi:hypothetical protein